ncbi:MAG TPA: HoxN/HupN/NixA family nickel/cobalt transporter [Chloroflexota bacterium]|nr:HoxN/HupN/NixA family nickel/cobalt transporter [Chloroflexota bacterium]
MLMSALRTIGAAPRGVKARVVGLYAFLIVFHILVWLLTILASVHYAWLLAPGMLAYTYGLRHAVDADHIAAIDNTTRKLMQDGQRPVAVGLFFSLGHSTVVTALFVVLALSTAYVEKHLPSLKATGAVIGMTVSCLFLLLIGLINLAVLLDIVKMWRNVSRGGTYDDTTLDEFLNNRGFIARLLKPLLKIVAHSWSMYPVGILFGLGFDTASEILFLGIAASTAAHHVPLHDLLLLPALFTAGMSLIDTTDGMLMMGAYGWAFLKPIRKLYYNLTITLISVLIALGIGSIEGLQVLSGQLNWTGPFWDFVNDKLDFETLGYVIIGIFVVSWGVSTALYKWRGYDDRPEASSPSRFAGVGR